MEKKFQNYILTTIVATTTLEKEDLVNLDEKIKELLAQLDKNERFLSFRKYLNKKKVYIKKQKTL